LTIRSKNPLEWFPCPNIQPYCIYVCSLWLSLNISDEFNLAYMQKSRLHSRQWYSQTTLYSRLGPPLSFFSKACHSSHDYGFYGNFISHKRTWGLILNPHDRGGSISWKLWGHPPHISSSRLLKTPFNLQFLTIWQVSSFKATERPIISLKMTLIKFLPLTCFCRSLIKWYKRRNFCVCFFV
jgi:hypothetical protein